MRILMLNYEFPPLGGGSANATQHLLREFSNQSEIKIDLITSSVGRFKAEDFSPNIRIFYLDIGKRDNLHFQSIRELLTYSIKSYFFARKLKKKNNYDLVHAFFGIPSGFIAQKIRLPYIVSLRGSDVPFYSRRFRVLDQLVFKRLSRNVWRGARKVVANSSVLKKLALQTDPSLTIPVIPNGVDLNYFYPSSTINPAFTVISTSRLIKRKGLEYLIEGFAKFKTECPKAKLMIVGDGNGREKLTEMAHGISGVEFWGKQSKEKLAELYRAADVFALPSQAEGMSNSLLEAMASGLGVVLTRPAAPSELIGPENALVLDQNDSNSIALALKVLAIQPELLQRMRFANRRQAENFSWQKMAREYFKIYAEYSPIKNK